MSDSAPSPLPVYASHVVQRAVAAQFAARPTVRAVVTQWLTRQLAQSITLKQHAFDLSHTYLVLTVDAQGQPLATQRYRLLIDEVLEHVASRAPLTYRYYDDPTCFVAMSPVAPPVGGFVPIEPMSVIEPVLLELLNIWPVAFQDALIAYWNQPVDAGSARLHWVGQMIQDQMLTGIARAPELTDNQRKALRQVVRYPHRNERLRERPLKARLFDAQTAVTVHSVAGRLWAAGRRFDVVTPDTVIEVVENGVSTWFYCTPGGTLQRFASLGTLTRFWSLRFASRYRLQRAQCVLYEPAGNFLDTQSMCVLERQLDAIGALDHPITLAALEQRIQAVTDTAAVFKVSEAPEPLDLAPVYAALPPWLRNACAADRFEYRSQLVALASVYTLAQGKRFNDDIPDLYTYTAQALRQQMLLDQPQAPGYNPDDIQLTFVDPVGPGGEGTVGTLNRFTLTLTELAVENLTAIRGSRMTITHAKGQLIQDWWMTPDYIKRLVRRVNIGLRYPQWIRQCLLNDPDDALRRERLFTDELRVQLVLQALEITLRKTAPLSQRGFQMIKALMHPDPQMRAVGGQPVCIRPLTLLSVPTLPAHEVRSMFVIGPTEVRAGCHVLYRPLHKQPLVEYPSWDALFAAIAAPGELQRSVLAWLPDSARPLYEAGGFYRLNLPSRHVHADSSFPLIAGAATLGTFTLSQDFMHDLYLDMARTLSELADRQTVSNAEQRWQSLITGGWLLFSAVVPNLPLAWPLRVIAGISMTWLVVQNDIEQLRATDEQQKASALIDLIFNCALVLLHARPVVPRPLLQQEPDAVLIPASVRARETLQPLPAPPIIEAGVTHGVDVEVGHQLTALDFSWFTNPQVKYTRWQLSWLDRHHVSGFKSDKPAIDRGPYQGLLVFKHQLYAEVDNWVYRVQLEDDDVYLVNPHDPQDRGPRILRNAQGEWTYDLRLRLRGGTPQSRLRAKKEQRIKRLTELREQLTLYNARAKVLETEMTAAQTLSDKVNADEPETADLTRRRAALENYIAVMERQKPEYEAALKLFLEKQEVLAEEKDPANLVGFYKFLIRLTSTLFDNHLMLTGVFKAQHPDVFSSEGQFVSVQTLRSAAYRADCQAIIDAFDKAAGYFRELETYIRALRAVPKLGHATALEAQKKYVLFEQADMTHYRSSVVCRGYQLLVLPELIVSSPGSADWVAVRKILTDLFYTSQSQYALEDQSLFSLEERAEILTDVRERYARADDALGIFQEEAGARLNRPAFNTVLSILVELDQRAEAMLDEQAKEQSQWLPAQPRPARTPSYTRKIVRTRKKGILVGIPRQNTREGDAEVVDVGDLSGASVRSTSPSPHLTVSFKQTAPDQWVEVQAPVVVPERPLSELKTEANTLVQGLNAQIRRVKGYAKRSRFPLELEEILDRYAQKLDRLVLEIKQAAPDETAVEHPKPGTVPMYIKRLENGAALLRSQGVELLMSLPPTTATVNFLLEKQHVSVHKLEPRVALRGERQGFVQEYEIKNPAGNVLWYAHLHYKAADSPAQNVEAAHFKLAAQRYASQPAEDAKAKPGRAPTQVYYAPISQKLLTERFLALDVQ